jgi:integrase
LAPKTIKNHHGIISKALQDAVNEGVIARNPATAVKLPKIPQRILATYSEDEANALTSAAKDSDLYVPILLALRCGLRRGEILGLQWKSVDLKNGTIVIQDTMTKTQTVIVREGTKTVSSYRKLLLPDVVIKALRAHMAEQEEHKAFLGTGHRQRLSVCASEW